MFEGRGERATGTPNTIYDLSSVLFHALEGGASYDTYIQDAEEAGDQELADFFRQVRDEDSRRADEAQRLIAERTTTTAGAGGGISGAGVAAGVPPTGAEPTDLTPGSELMDDVPPGGTEPGAVRPGTEPMEDVPPPDAEPGGVRPGTEPMEDVPPPRTEPGGVTSGMEDIPPRTDEPLGGPEEVPPPRTSGIEEGTLPRTEEAPPPPMEDRPLGTEGTMPPRAEEAPLAGGREETRQGEREEDKGLIDRVRDALSPDDDEEERRRREGTDEPGRR